MASPQTQTPRRKTGFNFGVKGWLLILYVMVSWMFISGGWWSGAAQNTMVAAKAAQLGVEPATILEMNSIIGYVSCIFCLGIGILYGKYKTHIVHTLLLIIGGAACCFYGYVDSPVGYYIAFGLVVIMANSASQVGEPSLITNWFPTRKGAALGWASIGNNLTTLIVLPILAALIAWGGPGKALACFGIATIVMALINWFLIPVDPRKAGFEPDNGDNTPEELEMLAKRMSGPEVWTNKEAFSNRNFWLIGIAYGLLFMVSSGCLQQMVPYQISMRVPELIASGVAPDAAPGMAAAAAGRWMKLLPLFALPGSIFGGWLDQKVGTRRAGLMMAGGYIISTLCGGLLPFNQVTNIIFVFMFFFMTGSNANLVMSHAMSFFGPRDYGHIYGRMAVLLQLGTVTAPLVLANSLRISGNYRLGYAAFFVASCIGFILIFIAANRADKEPGQPATAYYKD